jgi:hypothetical protein
VYDQHSVWSADELVGEPTAQVRRIQLAREELCSLHPHVPEETDTVMFKRDADIRFLCQLTTRARRVVVRASCARRCFGLTPLHGEVEIPIFLRLVGPAERVSAHEILVIGCCANMQLSFGFLDPPRFQAGR